MASANELGKAAGDFIAAIGKEGAFALGTLLGCMVTSIGQWLASRERVARLKIDLETAKELHTQLKLKDERINALHKELEKHITRKGKE